MDNIIYKLCKAIRSVVRVSHCRSAITNSPFNYLFLKQKRKQKELAIEYYSRKKKKIKREIF